MAMDLMDHALIGAEIDSAVRNNQQSPPSAVGVAVGIAVAKERQEKNEIIEKYNALVKKYDDDIRMQNEEFDVACAGRDYFMGIVKDNLENIPMSKDEITRGLSEAQNAARAKYRTK